MHKVVLVSEGSSDRVLCPILEWLFNRHGYEAVFLVEWADLASLRIRTDGLAGKIDAALQNYPCAVLCIHRDADNNTIVQRDEEIQTAWRSVRNRSTILEIPVIPVRMPEAWLLFDEQAINTASGNPNNRTPLRLPRITELETLRDPKNRLYEALKLASGGKARFLKKFSPQKAMHRIPDHIADYSPLLALHAFQALDRHVANVALRLIQS